MINMKYTSEISNIIAIISKTSTSDAIYMIMNVCLLLSLKNLGYKDWSNLYSYDAAFHQILKIDKDCSTIAGALGRQAMSMYIWLENINYEFTK